MISYFIIVSLVSLFLILFILSNCNLIFKNTKLGNFFKNPLLKQILKRISYCLLTLFIIITIIFIIMKIMPKAYFYGSLEITEFSIKSPIYNSDKSLFNQLTDYYYNILPFPKKVCSSYHLIDGSYSCSRYNYKIINLGESYFYMRNVDVWTIIKEKCIISLYIGFIAYCLQCLIGYPLGFYMARKQNKFVDKTLNFVNISITSTPALLYFYIFILVFIVIFKMPVSFDFSNKLTFIPPLVALVFWGCFNNAYWVKRYVSVELDKDYVKLAIAKGLPPNVVFYKHIMKNALIPFIRTIPTAIGSSIKGFYLLEAVFNIPGAGLAILSSIKLQDVYLVQGFILFYSFISLCSHLLGDLITILLDKRVSLGKENYDGYQNT